MVDKGNWMSEEICVEVGQRKLTATLISPSEEKMSDKPVLLLTIQKTSFEEQKQLQDETFVAGKLFLDEGHRLLSVYMPCHHPLVDSYGYGIPGLRNAFVDGQDPFEMFLDYSSAVIDRCIDSGFAKPGRIAVLGSSRSAYFGFRLLAAESRIAAGAAFAPVTDWRYLSEFSADRNREDVANLRLSCYVDALAGKHIFMAIGNHDDRVSTASCCRFYLDLLEANDRRGYDDSYVDFYCTGDVGHALDRCYCLLLAERLLKRSSGSGMIQE